MTRSSRRRHSQLCATSPLASLLILTCIQLSCLTASASDTSYKPGEIVHLWANKISPYSSPSESYGYYEAVPWCRPPKIEHKALKFGQTLAGYRLASTHYNLSFRTPTLNAQICYKGFTANDVNKYIKAIKKRYVYELLVDDLPMKLFVGETSDDAAKPPVLYTHIDFVLSVNGPHIIEATATPAKSVELKEGEPAKLHFTYSVTWKDTTFPVERRAERYRDPLHHKDVEIHWFSIGNATLSVLLLMGLFGSILLRVVRKDFREYEALDGDEEADDYGWKLLHSDVFRFPRLLTILCPILGTGVQLFTLSVILLVFGALEFFHPLSHGAIYTTALLSFAGTSGVAGFVSAYYYKQMGGVKWVRNAFATVCVFSGPVAMMFVYLNTIALVYGSTRALPAWTIACICLLWGLVTIPLTIVGAMVGKNVSRPYDAPGRTAKIAREIPKAWWYRRPAAVAAVCGLMPFSAIYVEVYFMFGAVWGHKIFQVYEMLAIVFGMLMVVTTITTVSAVYFQLTMENYRWAWASVAYGGSIGAYLFGYSVVYYAMASPLSGFLQANFFFGYMLLVSYGFFLMCGTAGFFSARRFVRFLYSSVKND